MHLSLIKKVGPKSVLKIIKKFFQDFCSNYKNPEINLPKIDLTKIYEYRINDFVQKIYLTQSIAEAVFDGLKDTQSLEKELGLIEKYKIDILTFLDDAYPAELKQIYSPPTILYCKGLSLTSSEYAKRIAVVGARKANSYASAVINEIVPSLIQNNYSIVSGGASGVDSMAHVATIKNKGKTIVVLGSGLMCPYPESNKELFRTIARNGGTLVSPFPLLAEPLRGNFPARNRVIAGLCSGCLVVQAAKRSGALITAQFALDEGRQVFAIPGDIRDELSLGCHEIIKQGAKIVSCVDDILEELEDRNFSTKVVEEKSEKEKNIDPIKNRKKTIIPVVSKKKSKEISKPETKEKSLQNLQENIILSSLKNACSLDELSIKTKLDFNLLQEVLFDMQIEGKVKQNFIGFWEKG